VEFTAKVEAVFYKDLGMYTEDLFESFEPEARAAASLAQVHKATLPGGRAVAVKVQYPGLEVAVAHDMGTLRLLASAATLVFPDLRLGWIVESLSKSIAEEMDFRVEARNAKKLSQMLAHRRPGGSVGTCSVPELVPGLCTQRVLTMEWVDGCKVTNASCLEAAGLRPKQVGELLMHVFADLTFRTGCVHGDPHPGNILVRRRSAGTSLAACIAIFHPRSAQIVLGSFPSFPPSLLSLCYLLSWDHGMGRVESGRSCRQGYVLEQTDRPSEPGQISGSFISPAGEGRSSGRER